MSLSHNILQSTTLQSLWEISYLHPEVEDEVEEQVQYLQSPAKETLIMQSSVRTQTKLMIDLFQLHNWSFF